MKRDSPEPKATNTIPPTAATTAHTKNTHRHAVRHASVLAAHTCADTYERVCVCAHGRVRAHTWAHTHARRHAQLQRPPTQRHTHLIVVCLVVLEHLLGRAAAAIEQHTRHLRPGPQPRYRWYHSRQQPAVTDPLCWLFDCHGRVPCRGGPRTSGVIAPESCAAPLHTPYTPACAHKLACTHACGESGLNRSEKAVDRQSIRATSHACLNTCPHKITICRNVCVPLADQRTRVCVDMCIDMCVPAAGQRTHVCIDHAYRHVCAFSRPTNALGARSSGDVVAPLVAEKKGTRHTKKRHVHHASHAWRCPQACAMQHVATSRTQAGEAGGQRHERDAPGERCCVGCTDLRASRWGSGRGNAEATKVKAKVRRGKGGVGSAGSGKTSRRYRFLNA